MCFPTHNFRFSMCSFPLRFHLDICCLIGDITDYHFVAQGKTTIPNVDDGEEFILTDVSSVHTTTDSESALESFCPLPSFGGRLSRLTMTEFSRVNMNGCTKIPSREIITTKVFIKKTLRELTHCFFFFLKLRNKKIHMYFY